MATTRTGMLISEKGEQGHLPPWRWSETTNGAVAGFKQDINAMLQHASFYDMQNRRMFDYESAKVARPNLAPPLMPNNQARLSTARQRHKQLQQAKTQVIDKLSKLLGERDALTPFRFDPAGYNLRAEMRALARTMPEKERMALASRDSAFCEAIIEGPSFMTGIAQSQYDLLREQALKARHGPRLAEFDEGIEAGKTALATHTIIEKAISNEFARIGEPAVEATPPQPAEPPWQLLDVTATST